MKSDLDTIKTLINSDFSSDLTQFLIIVRGGGQPNIGVGPSQKDIKLRTCSIIDSETLTARTDLKSNPNPIKISITVLSADFPYEILPRNVNDLNFRSPN